MKKIISLLLLPATIFAFTACGGDEEKDEPKDSLNGTEWTHGMSERVEHLEFTSDTQVEYYHTQDGALVGKVSTGAYIKNGNNITFNNFEGNYNTEILTFKNATVSGKTMAVYYESSYFGSSNTTFRKVD